MKQKLNYEEWCKKYMVKVDPVMIEDLYQIGIDAVEEIEAARKREYEIYTSGGFDK